MPLYGDVDTLAPFWGAVNWNQRFVSAANPNKLYFNDGRLGERQQRGGRPGVRGAAQVARVPRAGRAREGLVRASTRSWAPATASWAASFPNQTKILPGNPDLDTADVGQYIKTRRHARAASRRRARPPAGDLLQHLLRRERVRRPAHHEAAYLFLQWAGGARVYTWLTFNPGGYQDPHHIYSLHDPNVSAELQAAAARAVREHHPAHGAADHDQGRRRVPRRRSPRSSRRCSRSSRRPSRPRRRSRTAGTRSPTSMGVETPGRGARRRSTRRSRRSSTRRPAAAGHGGLDRGRCSELADARSGWKHTPSSSKSGRRRRRRPDFGGRSDKKVAQTLIAPGQLLMVFIVLFPAVDRDLHRLHGVGPDQRRRLLARLRVLALVRRLLGGADRPGASGTRCGAPS